MQNSTSSTKPIRIGITHGDFNGIGYEVLLKTFADTRICTLFTPILYGQSKVLSYYKKNFAINEFNYSLTRDARQSWPGKFNVINIIEEEVKIDVGMASAEAGKSAVISLKKAAHDLQDGYLDALVTLPVNHKIMKSEGFDFNSQTDYLQSLFGGAEPMKLLVNDYMRIGLVTSHMPLEKAVDTIDKNLILNRLKVMNKTLKADFNIASPKIAVLGLNPHAGDSGLLGAEENNVIAPAIKEACDGGMLVFGPFASDYLFLNGVWSKYDAILAMYHDQAFAPFEIMSANGGVIYTAGLPVVRTAPDMDVSYDIANKDMASPDSFRKALYLALDIVRNRQRIGG